VTATTPEPQPISQAENHQILTDHPEGVRDSGSITETAITPPSNLAKYNPSTKKRNSQSKQKSGSVTPSPSNTNHIEIDPNEFFLSPVGKKRTTKVQNENPSPTSTQPIKKTRKDSSEEEDLSSQ